MRITVLLFLLLLVACQPAVELPKIDDAYLDSFTTYEKSRQEERDYYLKLCGLTKLPSLTSSYGSDSTADISVIVPGIPSNVGFFVNQSPEIQFISNPDVQVKDSKGQVVDTVQFQLDTNGNSEKLFVSNLSWMIITRGEAPYVRSWNESHPAVAAFEKFARFDLTEDFIFEANFTYYEQPRERTVSTQLGPPEIVQMIGELTFEYQGSRHSLEVGNNGFTMVGDATTGNETYGGGRYIDLALPEQSGPMVLDFNKLYNPPCTFSEYTTCQYPSEQNILPFELTAGELYSGH